jgi:hypothetical protein
MNAITRGMLTAALSNDSELTEFERACFCHLVDIDPIRPNNAIVIPLSPARTSAPKSSGPEWLRLPAPGKRCPHSGLSRSTLNALTIPGPANDNRPPVKSVVLRKRGALRGIRLISYDSLMLHLENVSAAPQRGAESTFQPS